MSLGSEGRRLLSDVVRRLGARETGRRSGVAESTISHAVAGRKKPGARVLGRLQKAFGISVASWGVSAAPTPPRAAQAPQTIRKRRSMRGIRELRAAILAFDVQLKAAEASEEISPTAWASLLRGKADAAAKLAKLQGEGELTMATLVRSRIWSEVLSTMRPVLSRYPECAAELAEAFEALEQA